MLTKLTCCRFSFYSFKKIVFNLYLKLITYLHFTLKYKSIAEVNEDALKQIETAHENYKLEVF